MWLVFAFGSALFAGVTAILAKVGVRHTPSNLATAIRTCVVLLFAWLVVFVVGSQSTIGSLSGPTLFFLGVSGLATGASWLCYFRALQLADVNQVVPIDKSSIVLTVAFAILLLVPYAIFKLLANRMGEASRNSVLGPIDRLIGFGFGAIKGALITVVSFSVLVLGYDTVWGPGGRPDWIKLSRSYPFVNAASEELVQMIAERRQAAAEEDARQIKEDEARAGKRG